MLFQGQARDEVVLGSSNRDQGGESGHLCRSFTGIANRIDSGLNVTCQE